MVGCCPVFLCRDRLTWGTRRHDERWTRDCFLRTVRYHTLFFPMAPCQGLTHQYSGVFQLTGSPDTGLGVRVYLAAHNTAMRCSAPLSTLVNVSSSDPHPPLKPSPGGKGEEH